MEPVLIVLVVFGSVGLVTWRWIEARQKVRIAMIEKGVTPADFKGMSVGDMLRSNPLSSLKWGLLLMFVGIGSLIATWFDEVYNLRDSIYLASMLVWGGLALIIFYFIAAKKMKQD